VINLRNNNQKQSQTLESTRQFKRPLGVPKARVELSKESPHKHAPLKIADPSMKTLQLYKVINNQKFESYAQRQGSVHTRNITNDRIMSCIEDLMPATAVNAMHSRSRSVFKKKLHIGHDPSVAKYAIKEKLKTNGIVFDTSRPKFSDIQLLHDMSISVDDGE
jgi:hypothetical protein